MFVCVSNAQKLNQEIKTILRKGNENKGHSFILTALFLTIGGAADPEAMYDLCQIL